MIIFIASLTMTLVCFLILFSTFDHGWLFIPACIFSVSALVSGINLAEEQSCKKKSEIMKLDSHYGFFEGCLIKSGDNWFPLRYYRASEEIK